ncbi:MAG: endonuclease/exonuclease/phosphatase family protein [Clostridia bacterium]|nr:endonuclease/exonuclease/phosphatase family protein [Clostridia bacterium]
MSIKVMTFNLRMHTTGDGINAFFNRIDRVLQVINEEAPDVIGFQEVTDEMRSKLREELKNYTIIGCGRNTDYHDEAMIIAYLTSKIELISCENKWLSPAPDIPGSRYGGDQSGCPRMYTSALLKHCDVKKPFRFINTHLDHCGEMARYLGSMQLVQAISQMNEKFVLTGDFNATPDTKEIKLITEALSFKNAIDCSADIEPTFHNFGKLPPEKRVKIDYIFTDARCEGCYKIDDTPIEGKYYSDHEAICAILSLD